MEGGREAQAGGDICVHIADSVAKQKLTKRYKVIILQ